MTQQRRVEGSKERTNERTQDDGVGVRRLLVRLWSWLGSKREGLCSRSGTRQAFVKPDTFRAS